MGLTVAGVLSWVSAQPDGDGAGTLPSSTNASPASKPFTLTRQHLAAPPAPAADVGRPVLPDQYVLLDGEKHLYAGFPRLTSFPFRVTPEMTASNSEAARASVLQGLPKDVTGLNGKEVAVVGFMRPGTTEHGLVKDFLLVSHLDSCLGHEEPHLTDKMLVRMKAEGVSPIEKLPLAAVGTFRIEPVSIDGEMLFLYQVDAERIVPGNLIQFLQ